MKNEAISADVSRSPSTSACTSAGGQVFSRVGPAVLGQRCRVGADVHRDLDELVEVGGQVGIAEAKDDVGPVEDPVVVLFGNAHHVADDLQGQRAGQLRDQLAVAVGVLLDHRRDQRRARSRTDASVRATTFGVNARLTMLRSRVPRIVQHDHRPEVLGQHPRSASSMVMLGLELKISG